MLKYIKYLFFAAVTLMAAVGCQEDPEDTFSKEPTAPVMVNNGYILLTKNTMTEDVTWAWTATRFATNVTYTLYAEYNGGTPKQVGSTSDLCYTMSKVNFHELLATMSDVPENATYTLDFYVTAQAAEGSVTSEKQSVTVYSYGNAISPVVTAGAASLELDMNNPNGTINLLSWEAARLEYGEAITYNVYAQYGDNDAILMAEGLTGTSYSLTTDELNEFCVAAGAPESQASDVKFYVAAVSDTYTSGVPSTPVTVNVLTYTATYPDQLYLPGSYCGWGFGSDCAVIPASTLTKGLFEAFVDLSVSDGSDVQFKFSPVAAWQGDFGSNDLSVSTDKGYAVASGTTNGGDNLVVPSGMYRVSVNMKFKTVELEQIKTVGIIGDAVSTGWSSEIKMNYDAKARTYSVTTDLTNGKSYKFRINDDWDYSIGDNGAFSGGENYTVEKETGEYKVILNVASHPYTVKVLSTSYPENLYLPGEHNGWSFTDYIQGNGEGQYEGAVNLGANWKFSPVAAWKDDFAGTITSEENGYITGTTGGGGNITTPAGYYYLTVDMTKEEFTMTQITKVGLIGGFNSWGGDVDFTYNKDQDVWTLTTDLIANDGFKIRMNGGWDMNRGGAAKIGTFNVVNNGDNMSVAEDGNYTITLNMKTNPNTVTIKKN